MKLEEITIADAMQIAALFGNKHPLPSIDNTSCNIHPMVGRRCVIRTYSAGVHIGDVEFANGTEVRLKNALRLWKWTGGGLSLSDVATKGIKGGRLNRTPEVYLTNAIEFIPTTEEAEKTYVQFIE